MAVEFGFSPVEAHPKTHLTKWMDDLDVILPQFVGHFKSLWMTDHLFWEDNFAYEGWTVLSFLAAKWPQFDVGPMVIGQNYRNPGLLAKMGATLQVFSEGRFIMGLGAGWKEDEYRAFHYDFPSAEVRLEQLEDTLEIVRRLWTESGKVSYQGKHYGITEAILEPKPDPVPPILIGVKGDNALKIAAKYADWWNLPDANAALFRERLAVLRQHCETVGRDPASIRLTWFGRMIIAENEAEAQRLAKSREKSYTRENALLGTPEQVVEQMLEFVELGVDYFMMDIIGLPNADTQAMMVEHVLPKVRGTSA